MPTIWTYADVMDGKLSSLSLEILTRAAQLGDACAVLLGAAPEDAFASGLALRHVDVRSALQGAADW